MQNQTPKTPELLSIQILRAIAALLVVSCHIGAVEGQYTGSHITPEWGKYGVDLFFVISGFIIAYISRDKWGNASEIKPFLLKRVMRIYPVYWEFTLVIIAVMLVHPSMLNMSIANHPSIVKSLLLWPQMVDPLLGVGWSLVHEMYFYILFCAAFLLPRKLISFAFAGWFLLLLYIRVIGVNISTQTGEWWLVTSPLGFEFMMGCALAWLFRRNIRVNALLLLVAAVIWCIAANMLIDAEASLSQRVIVWGIPSALLLYAAVMFETAGAYQFPLWLLAIGDASYSLYLSHPLVISALGKFWQYVGWLGVFAHCMFIIISAAVCISVALLNYRYFEQPLSRWYHAKLQNYNFRRRRPSGGR